MASTLIRVLKEAGYDVREEIISPEEAIAEKRRFAEDLRAGVEDAYAPYDAPPPDEHSMMGGVMGEVEQLKSDAKRIYKAFRIHYSQKFEVPDSEDVEKRMEEEKIRVDRVFEELVARIRLNSRRPLPDHMPNYSQPEGQRFTLSGYVTILYPKKVVLFE